jgi:xanthine dehydrogenase accessory factor
MTHAPVWSASECIRLVEAGVPTALVTIVSTEGSAPREAGARMIVTEKDAIGTVGGGNLECQLIDQARRLLRRADIHILQQDYPLGPLLAQCCGGRVSVLIERLEQSSLQWLKALSEAADPRRSCMLEGRIVDGRIARTVHSGLNDGRPEGIELIGAGRRRVGLQPGWSGIIERIAPRAPELFLFGAGHVGKAVAQVAKMLPFRFVWVDPRPEMANGCDPPPAARSDLAAVVCEARPEAFFLVMTHSHELDFAVVRAVLARDDAAYCGLIGSATKRARFVSRLEKQGVRSSGLICPIGLAGIRGKDPASIAISTAADLLARLEAAQQRVSMASSLPQADLGPGRRTSLKPAKTVS